jgi:formiminotetrahydrofolate cyclodeaminase
MSKFVDQPLSAFLDALASAEPTPGGGTAAAIAGAMGVSLLMMVGGLSKSRAGAETERVDLAEARAALASIRDRLAGLGDTDAEAFNQVMAAYRLPKSTDQEKSARKDAIQQGLKAASIAPLDTLRAAGEALRLARVVAQHGNRSAVSDVAVGIGLLEAAAKGAAANVRINLESLLDEGFKASASADVDAIDKQLREDAAAANATLQGN